MKIKNILDKTTILPSSEKAGHQASTSVRKVTLTHVVAFEINADPRYSIAATIPDMPGCFSGSDVSLDEARKVMVDAMRTWIQGHLDQGIPIKMPSSLEEIKQRPDFDTGWKLETVTIDVSTLWDRIVQLNEKGGDLSDWGILTLPSNLEKDIPPLTLNLIERLTGMTLEHEDHMPQVQLADC